MADNTDISQFITETAADSSSAQISQDIVEIGSSASAAQISQDVVEIGANASRAQISQLEIEIGSAKSAAIISQLTIECGRGPEVVPPSDSPMAMFTFGFGGLDVNWYLIPSVTDNNEQLRDKVVRAFNVTGKITNPDARLYRWGPTENINVDDLEDGLNAAAIVNLTSTTQVVRSARFPVNVANAMLHTIRVAGRWGGLNGPDRVDEIIVEQAIQGRRR